MFGHVEGTIIGQHFPNRRALHEAGIHRGLIQGIAPNGTCIVLNGGYVDDIDEGDTIIYTGYGGNDPNTKRQVADQELTSWNRHLADNYRKGNPVRVVRGYNLDSDYKTESGYRYDGLYRVDAYWSETGQDGFLIWRFRLVRLEDQPPLKNLVSPGSDTLTPSAPQGSETPGRSSVITSRVIRSSQVGNHVKELYDFCCQVCGVRLNTPTGPYAECCHIRPLGKPHNGPDTLDNVLCMCPNCHVLFDNHAIWVRDDLSLGGVSGTLTSTADHNINTDHLGYHRKLSNLS